MDEWQFSRVLIDAFQSAGAIQADANRLTALVRLLIHQRAWFTSLGSLPLSSILEAWLSQDEIRYFLQVNRHQDILWFNQEAFEEFLWWMMGLAVLEALPNRQATSTQAVEHILGAYDIVQRLLKAETTSAFQVEKLVRESHKVHREVHQIYLTPLPSKIGRRYFNAFFDGMPSQKLHNTLPIWEGGRGMEGS